MGKDAISSTVVEVYTGEIPHEIEANVARLSTQADHMSIEDKDLVWGILRTWAGDNELKMNWILTHTKNHDLSIKIGSF